MTPTTFLAAMFVIGYLVMARATNGYVLAIYPSMSAAARVAWSLAWPVGFLIEIGRGPK